MTKIKEVPTSEVHKVMRWDAKEQANDFGKTQLGAELSRHFADVIVATNSYVWSHAEGGWTSLSAAPAEERTAATAARDQLFASVRAKLTGSTTATAEEFLTYPNDDYVFYKRRADGSIDILLTGWGFRNQKKEENHTIKVKTDETTRQDLCLSFLDDGVPAPNRAFYFTTNQTLNHATTDAEGRYRLEGVEAGKEIQVTDEKTRRSFSFTVEKGRSDYGFDVTRRAEIVVLVRQDGLPAVSESVTLTYGERTLTAATNAAGEARFGIVYREEGGDATAQVRDKQQTFAPSDERTSIVFDFQKPIEPVIEPPVEEPAPTTINVSVRDHADKPFAGANIVFRQGTKELPLVLDETGTTHFPSDTFATGVPVEALLTTPTHKYPAIPFTIDPAEHDYLLREEKTPWPWWYTLLIVLGVLTLIVAFFYIGLGYIMGIDELHNYFDI